VSTVPLLSSDVVPATVFPFGSVREKAAVPAWIGLLKVAVTLVLTGTLVAELPGVVDVTTGAAV
jgi:hypothetical protein